jgi:hypothetical protein
MSFRRAVEATAEISGAYRSGLQALSTSAKSAIRAANTRLLDGSVDLDEALRPMYPQQPRWDYVVAFRRANHDPKKLAWVEYHHANADTAAEVARKAVWIRDWAASHGRPLLEYSDGGMDLRWIASGRIGFGKQSRQARILAKSGVHFPVRNLDLN